MPTVPSKSNRKNRRRTGPDEYRAMLESHRHRHGAHKRAAEAAGVSYNTARKAYSDGLGPEMPPIMQVLHREMVEARAELRRLEGSRRADQRSVQERAADGVQQRVADGRVLRMARENTLVALGSASHLVAQGLRISKRLDALMADPDWHPTPKEVVAITRSIAAISGACTKAVADIQALEEQVLGPAGAVPNAPLAMTTEEAVRTLLSAEETLAKLRARAARADEQAESVA